MVSPVRTGESQFAFADAVSFLANKRALLNADDSRDTLGSAATRTHTHTRACMYALVRIHRYVQTGAISVIISTAWISGWLVVETRRSMRSHACT